MVFAEQTSTKISNESQAVSQSGISTELESTTFNLDVPTDGEEVLIYLIVDEEGNVELYNEHEIDTLELDELSSTASLSATVAVSLVRWYTGTSSDYIEVRAKADATTGSMKNVWGHIKAQNPNLLNPTLYSEFDFNLSNNAGTQHLVNNWDMWVGSANSVQLKLSNVTIEDLYGDDYSGITLTSVIYYRP